MKSLGPYWYVMQRRHSAEPWVVQQGLTQEQAKATKAALATVGMIAVVGYGRPFGMGG